MYNFDVQEKEFLIVEDRISSISKSEYFDNIDNRVCYDPEFTKFGKTKALQVKFSRENKKSKTWKWIPLDEVITYFNNTSVWQNDRIMIKGTDGFYNWSCGISDAILEELKKL